MKTNLDNRKTDTLKKYKMEKLSFRKKRIGEMYACV